MKDFIVDISVNLRRTYRRLLDNVWWPNMMDDIRDYIRNTKICVLTKRKQKNSRLGKRLFPTQPNELISIDYIVDFPITSRRNIHILTRVDNLTKYVKCYAVKDRTALIAS